MCLDFSGAPEVAASRERGCASLLDYEFVASCAPGVESAEPIDDGHYKVVVAFGVGPIKLRFLLDVALSKLNPPRSAVMLANGKVSGSNIQVDTRVELEELETHQTPLDWESAADVHGTVAGVGSCLLKGTARELIDDFWETFAARAPERSA